MYMRMSGFQRLPGGILISFTIPYSDSFVNSQEWTLARSVPDIRLGIVGSLSSGKSALVHRYLTGSYMMEESPEGGRFKKEVVVDGQSYLLLIRDEGGPPELQFSTWVDAVIFVFRSVIETPCIAGVRGAIVHAVGAVCKSASSDGRQRARKREGGVGCLRQGGQS